jgi:hypothetical protein
MLTPKKIAALQPREKRFTVTDGHGLTLRIHPSGAKTWCLRLSLGGRVSDTVQPKSFRPYVLIKAKTLREAGCTVFDAPYAEEEREASKLISFARVSDQFTS